MKNKEIITLIERKTRRLGHAGKQACRRDARLTNHCALRAQDLAGIKCEPTRGLPLDTLTSLSQVLLARG